MVKNQPVWKMIPSNENVEDKVKNEKRSIYFGLILALGLGLISTILAILYGWDCFKDTDQIGLRDHSNVIILSGHHTSSEGKLGATYSAFTGNISKHIEAHQGALKNIEAYWDKLRHSETY